MLGLVGPLLGTTAGLLLITSWRSRAPSIMLSEFHPGRSGGRSAPLRWGLPLAVTLRAIAGYHHPKGWLEFLRQLAWGSRRIGLMVEVQSGKRGALRVAGG